MKKTAIVTGGTKGIGKAICAKLLKEGCNVIATGVEDNISSYRSSKYLKYVYLNVMDYSSINAFLSLMNKTKRIDILINNAGINRIEAIDKVKKESWDSVIQVNLTAPMLIAQKAAVIMKKQETAKILNISSIWGVIGKEKRNSYSASKTGLIGLTRAMALDLAPYNILVNALCPGFTMTELTKASLSIKEMRKLSAQVPLKRFASVDDIAKVAVFLCSDNNAYITGQTIVADGGFVIS